MSAVARLFLDLHGSEVRLGVWMWPWDETVRANLAVCVYERLFTYYWWSDFLGLIMKQLCYVYILSWNNASLLIVMLNFKFW